MSDLYLHVVDSTLPQNICQGKSHHKCLIVLTLGVRDRKQTGKVHAEDVNNISKVLLFFSEVVDP